GEVSREVSLGPGREFDAIRLMLDRWGARARGIGDDAAVLDVAPGASLVASVDAAVEGRHFRREWLTPREIGYRAVAAALSDLAAMAARPLGVLIALGAPDAWRGALAGIDVSAGLAADVGHLASASHVAIEIALDRVPRLDGVDPRPAVAGGEDYELVVTASQPIDVVAFEKSFGLPLTEIGRVATGN